MNGEASISHSSRLRELTKEYPELVMLSFALRVTNNYEGLHIGPFVLPPLDFTLSA